MTFKISEPSQYVWWSYFTALRLCVLWWVDHGRDAAGLSYSELKRGSQLLQETLLKLENDHYFSLSNQSRSLFSFSHVV